MTKNKKITVQHIDIVLYEENREDYISLTDIARYKGAGHTDDIIKNWMRNRNTIELLGFWETIYNPDFKSVEFDGFRKQAGFLYANEADLLNVALFGTTAKEWREQHPDTPGNIRDYANLEQLVVLSNMESINALLIRNGFSQTERLIELNKVAITQMKSLLKNSSIKKLHF
ncbi:MAG: KilA-N domain-containing protein [Chitinophagaceae bacterium]|nr:KilA-N domain-containing protein [Chitinophagaceae bacterium]